MLVASYPCLLNRSIAVRSTVSWSCPGRPRRGVPTAAPASMRVSVSRHQRVGVQDDLLLVEAGQPVAPGVLGRVANVDDQQGAQGGAGEDVLVQRPGVEAAHRAGGQPGGTDAEEEVADLQRRVEACDVLALRVVGEPVL